MELRGEDSFSDSYHWELLAKERKLRLPMWRFPTTTGGMRKWLKKLGITVDEYLQEENFKNLKEFAKLNPDWPLRAWVGIRLENMDWIDNGMKEWEAILEAERLARIALEPAEKRPVGRPRKVVPA